MDTVFLLQHSHALGGQMDMKLLGVYDTKSEARAALVRVQDKPGFVDSPEGFRIEQYILNKEYWVEGCLDK